VVKERRILREVKHLKDKLWVTFWLMAIGPIQNQEVTTLKIVTFFLVPVLTQTGDASLIRMLTASISIWCQDLGEMG